MNLIKNLILILILTNTSLVFAQNQSTMDIALRFIEQNHSSLHLNADEISDLNIKDIAYNKENGITHLYFYQSYNGVEANNGIISIHINAKGEVVFSNSNAIIDFRNRMRVSSPAIGHKTAIRSVFNNFDISPIANLNTIKTSKTYFRYENKEFLVSDLITKLVGFEKDNKVTLAWSVMLHHKELNDLWNVMVDASSGKVLDKISLTNHCKFDHSHNSSCNNKSNSFLSNRSSVKIQDFQRAESSLGADGSAYKVFAMPAESPSHGPHVVVTDPAHIGASPYGWHDINAIDGPEYTTLRGNNVHIILDRDGDFVADNPTPDGGTDLQFIFDHNPDSEATAIENENASLTNLFYMVNTLHDFSFQYGFDEDYNFQANNYINSDNGSDHVEAYAQFGSQSTRDTFLNNANFSTPGDGQNGVMRMYVWNRAAANLQLVTITEPASSVSGFTASTAGFGADLEDNPIEGEVILVNDGSSSPTLNCQPDAENDLTGKIALIDRGVCEFGLKILNAERGGAIAAIVCNYQDGLINMGAGRVGSQVNIPSVFMSKSDCDKIKISLGETTRIKLEIPSNSGPNLLTGEFDNGIIAHEYGHGISNRFTGGSSSPTCLTNTEQMGEGWSDFMTLVTSTTSADAPGAKRGIGTYVTREENSGVGIRTYPYSNDMNVNPHTYDNIITESLPHGVGSVWNAMLWDLYWAMVDVYSFDDDLFNGDGGNNRAIRLVFEGMKMQKCNPGFTDGRDGILAADRMLYNGDNQCLIWEVFARRGLGYSADQGSNNSREDGTEAFDMPPFCPGTLFLTKTADKDIINAGDNFTITLSVTNYTGSDKTGVVITDEIPTGATVDESSISSTFTITGNEISFEIGNLTALGEINVSYQVISSSQDQHTSAYSMHEDWEDGEGDWEVTIDEVSSFFWYTELRDEGISDPYSGDAYLVAYIPENSAVQHLFNTETFSVPNDQPVIRFFHKYVTEKAVDGGIIEVSEDGGNHWTNLHSNFFRKGYRGLMQSPALPGPIEAFWGKEEEYIGSYVDLSDFAGKDVLLRFSLGSNFENVSQDILYWVLDDVDIFSMFNYDGEACVTSSDGSSSCAKMEGEGVIVEPDFVISNDEPTIKSISMNISPNPTNDKVTLTMNAFKSSDATIEVTSINGQVVLQNEVKIIQGIQQFELNMNQLKSGTYFISVKHEGGSIVEKVIKL